MKNEMVRSDSGQGMVEYGLILALVSVVSIGALTGVGGGVKDKFEQVSGALRGEGVTESPSGQPVSEPIYSDDELANLIKNENHIPIASAEDLNSLRNSTKQTFGAGTSWEGEYISGLDKKYIQVSDIDLSGNDNFEPIGNSDNEFKGKYDGGGYEINNLTIYRPSEDRVGLFGYTNGSRIENIGLNKIDVIGNNRVGGLIGSHYNTSTINSYASGEVSGKGVQVGGLIGLQAGSSATKNSYASGEVSGNDNVGGLIGRQWNSSTRNSYASGNVFGKDNVGGLVGYQQTSHTKGSYASGEVRGNDKVGGLIGLKSGSINSHTMTTTTDSYASGKVTGVSQVGGLMGRIAHGTIDNSGWNGDLNAEGLGSRGNTIRTLGEVKGYSTEEIDGIIKDLIK